jgi:hypothetical protein
MSRLSCLAIAAALPAAILAGLAHEATSDPLPTRTTIVAHGITAAMRPALGGAVIADASRPFRIDTPRGAITGQVKDRVIRSPRTGFLHFYTTVIVDRGKWSAKEVDAIRLGLVWKTEFLREREGSPLDAALEVWWRFDGPPGKPALTVQRDFRSISFWFSPTEGMFTGDSRRFIHPGESSRALLIETRARDFALVGQTRLEFTHPFGGARHDIVTTYVPIYTGKTGELVPGPQTAPFATTLAVVQMGGVSR